MEGITWAGQKVLGFVDSIGRNTNTPLIPFSTK